MKSTMLHQSARVAIRSLFIFGCVLLLQFAAWSQDIDTIPKTVPEPISLIDVSEETEKVSEVIALTRQRLVTDRRLMEIDSEFNTMSEQFEQEIALTEEFAKVTPNKQKLDGQIRKWNRLLDVRQRWRDQITGFLSKMSASREVVQFDIETWRLTLEEARRLDAPGSLLFSIESTLGRLDTLLIDVDEQINVALDIGARITQQRVQARDIIDRLEDWDSSGELQAFYKRHESIWNTSFKGEEASTRSVKIATFSERIQVVREYYNNYSWAVNIYLLICVAIGLFIMYMKRRLRDSEQQVNHARVKIAQAVVEKYTVSTILYLAFLIGLFFLTNLPTLFAQLVTIGVLVTSLILFRSFVQPGFRWIIGFLIVAFVIEQLKGYIWFSSPGYRIYLYAEALFGLAVLSYYFIPWSKASVLTGSTLNKLLKIGAVIVIAANLICLVANTLGYTNLADILLQVAVQGSVITVVAYGIMVVLGAIISTGMSIYFSEQNETTRETGEIIRKRTEKIVKWLAVLIWVVFILVTAELYRPLFNSIELWLTEPWTFGEFSITPGSILSFFLVMVVTVLITKSISLVFEGGVLSFMRVNRGTMGAISMVLRYLIVGFAISIALGTLGVDMTKFGLIAGALGVGIGFGLQNIVANFIAGMILAFERPIEPGDTIEVNGIMGVVQRIGVRSSTIRLLDGADLLVPNNTLLTNDLINWTHADDKRRVEVAIGVAYGSDANQVKQILLEVAKGYAGALKVPEPIVWFDQFGGSSIDFRVLFWSHVDDALTAKSDVSIEIYNQLDANGIEIPFPRQDITILNNEDSDDNDD